jgi:transposase
MTADGHRVMAIMCEVGVSKATVWRWQDYFAEAGVDGLIKGRTNASGPLWGREHVMYAFCS